MENQKILRSAKEHSVKQKGVSVSTLVFGPEDGKPVACKKHGAPKGYVNLTSKRCKIDMCDTSAALEKYEGYCMRCFIHMFPDTKLSRTYKVKERHAADFVEKACGTMKSCQ